MSGIDSRSVPALLWFSQLVVAAVLGLYLLEQSWLCEVLSPGHRAMAVLLAVWAMTCCVIYAIPKVRGRIHPNEMIKAYASSVVSLSLLECCFRIALLSGIFGVGRPEVRFSEALGWELVPGVANVTRRGRATSHQAENSNFKIVAIGDSTTFGLGVRANHAWPSFMADILNGDPQWKNAYGSTCVRNLGVPGYGTDQSLIALKTYVRQERPDLIIYHMCTNDFCESYWDRNVYAPKGRLRFKPYYRVDDGQLLCKQSILPSPCATAWLTRGLRISKLFSFVDNQLSTFASIPNAPYWPIYAPLDEPYSRSREIVWRLVAEMSQIATNNGSQFVVTLSPTFFSSDQDWVDMVPRDPAFQNTRYGSFLQDFRTDARAVGVEAHEFVTEFVRQDGNRHYLLPDRSHLNADGNRVIAALTSKILAGSLDR